jgi:hypothetical protein
MKRFHYFIYKLNKIARHSKSMLSQMHELLGMYKFNLNFQ